MQKTAYEMRISDCSADVCSSDLSLPIFEGTNEILRLYIALSGLKDVGTSLGELRHAANDIFNNPIKGFGVLSGYAARRLKETTGVGTDTSERELHPTLRKAAASYATYAVSLSRSPGSRRRKHGQAENGGA